MFEENEQINLHGFMNYHDNACCCGNMPCVSMLRLPFILRTLVFVTFIGLLFSCSGSIKFSKYKAEARDTKQDFFVELNDGSIIKYGMLKHGLVKTRLYGDGTMITYNAEQIKAYQDKNAYWLKFRTYDAKNPSHLLSRYVDFFAMRLISGKIELYLFKPYAVVNSSGPVSASSITVIYLIRKGKDGALQGLDEWGVNLKNAISDNKAVKADFEELYGKGKLKNIVNVIEAYN
jgi:hypothetical protein